jgi:hypothetical protein
MFGMCSFWINTWIAKQLTNHLCVTRFYSTKQHSIVVGWWVQVFLCYRIPLPIDEQRTPVQLFHIHEPHDAVQNFWNMSNGFIRCPIHTMVATKLVNAKVLFEVEWHNRSGTEIFFWAATKFFWVNKFLKVESKIFLPTQHPILPTL